MRKPEGRKQSAESGQRPADPPRILIADDQRDVVEALRLLLKSEGYSIESAASPAEILRAVKNRDFDVVLMDLNYARDTTSGQEGLDLLAGLQNLDGSMPVVVMTAWGSVELAVEAMRRGARDFVEKPWENARLLSILKVQTQLGKALRRGQRLEAENALLRARGAPDIIVESPAMRRIMDLVGRVAPSDAAVLLRGENGTGKSLIARALHAISARSSYPLVTVNLGGLPEGLFESELFGHVKGAFTDAKSDRVGRFEMAEGGSLFLDEIANIAMPQQARLLRVLETGEFERVGSSKTRTADVRIVSATNADLESEVREGRFREDLYFRLNTVEILIPPLRQRLEDIAALATHFLNRFQRRYRKDLQGFTESALSQLLQHSWPGNVRELEHAVERGVLLAEGERISARDLGLRSSLETVEKLEEMTLDQVEKVLIQEALSRNDGNVSQAARQLGLSRSALYRRIERHGL